MVAFVNGERLLIRRHNPTGGRFGAWPDGSDDDERLLLLLLLSSAGTIMGGTRADFVSAAGANINRRHPTRVDGDLGGDDDDNER